MIDALVKLLKVKSLVTLALTGVFAYLALIGKLSGEQFMTIFSVVIFSYFKSQDEKKEEPKQVEYVNAPVVLPAKTAIYNDDEKK